MPTKSQIEWQRILAIIAGVALLLGIPSMWPYSYYQLLRWFVVIVGGYTAYLAFRTDNQSAAWISIAVAILFNPIAPFYFAKSTWTILDFIAAIVFFTIGRLPEKRA